MAMAAGGSTDGSEPDVKSLGDALAACLACGLDGSRDLILTAQVHDEREDSSLESSTITF